MNQASIIFPVMVLVGWTLAVLLVIPFRRFRAAFAGQVTVRDFANGESANVPAAVSIPNRNYMNLLEAPVLFYVVCIVLFVMQKVDPVSVALAWMYVGFRVLHSLVHLTYNNVMHRLVFFAGSTVVLAILWISSLRGL